MFLMGYLLRIKGSKSFKSNMNLYEYNIHNFRGDCTNEFKILKLTRVVNEIIDYNINTNMYEKYRYLINSKWHHIYSDAIFLKLLNEKQFKFWKKMLGGEIGRRTF